jgi:hypothetical protein
MIVLIFKLCVNEYILDCMMYAPRAVCYVLCGLRVIVLLYCEMLNYKHAQERYSQCRSCYHH